LYGFLGLVLAPLGGAVTDRFGVQVLVFWMTVMTIVGCPLTFAPTLTLQMASVVLTTVLSVLQNTYFVRWFTVYTPPEHFGTYQGAVFTVCGVLAFILCSLLQVFSEIALQNLTRFLIPLGALCIANLVTTVAFYCHVRNVQMPSLPPDLSEGDEWQAGDNGRTPDQGASADRAGVLYQSVKTEESPGSD